MRTILAMSVLSAACGFWTGCASSDLSGSNTFAHDDRVDSDMLPADARAEIQSESELPQYGLDAASNTKVHFQMAFTDSKGKFRPDWAGNINRPVDRPLPITINPADRYTLEGAFNGENARLDAENRRELDRGVAVDSTGTDTTVRTDETRTDTTVRQDVTGSSDTVDRRYSIEGNRVVVDPNDPLYIQRRFVDSKGRFRPDWAGGINTPAMNQLTPDRIPDPAFRSPPPVTDNP